MPGLERNGFPAPDLLEIRMAREELRHLLSVLLRFTRTRGVHQHAAGYDMLRSGGKYLALHPHKFFEPFARPVPPRIRSPPKDARVAARHIGQNAVEHLVADLRDRFNPVEAYALQVRLKTPPTRGIHLLRDKAIRGLGDIGDIVLNADGAQTLSPDIFSGRIRPVDADGKVRIEALKAFLLKAAEARLHPPVMDQMLFFSGHGYISESKTARLDEKRVWYEHFPRIDDGRNHISYIDYSDVNPVKPHLMNEIMRPELNVAMLHHHGAPDTEYLNASERPYMVRDAKEYIMKNLRDHVYSARRKGKDYRKVQAELKERFDVPDSWFQGVFDDEVHQADSLADAALDLYIEDFAGYGYKPAAQLVVLDACYNGSFQLDNCIADEYIFQEGGTVAVQANSVNSLQDKWHDRFFGIVAAGGCAGDLVRYAPYIESHLIGDPTFRFASSGKNLDRLILKDSKWAWKRLLRKGTPDQQALAVEHLYRKGALSSARLLDIYRTSPYAVVRMEAFYCLSRTKGDAFIEGLVLAMEDADEFIRRIAVKYAGKSGDARLIPAVVKMFLTNNATSRIVFDTSYALLSFDKDALMAEFEKQLAQVKMVNVTEDADKLRQSFERSATRFLDDQAAITDPATSAKERRSCIRQIRSNLNYAFVPGLLAYLRAATDPEVQVMLLEALGWHRLAWNADEIAQVAQAMSEDASLPENVRREALKTYKRIAE